jgi:formylmethanofuran dehydrogenase subunit E
LKTALRKIALTDSLSHLLETASRRHSHLCPRQVLGVRIGLYGMKAINLKSPIDKERGLVIVESDGCFTDGIAAAAGCSVGNRTLRVEDYGKIAATFIDITSGRAVRLAPRLDVRQRALAYAPAELCHYSAQLHAYQIMPDDELLSSQPVQIGKALQDWLGRPGLRVNCAQCGEEIINEREILVSGITLCRACAGQAYYDAETQEPIASQIEHPTLYG